MFTARRTRRAFSFMISRILILLYLKTTSELNQTTLTEVAAPRYNFFPYFLVRTTPPPRSLPVRSRTIKNLSKPSSRKPLHSDPSRPDPKTDEGGGTKEERGEKREEGGGRREEGEDKEGGDRKPLHSGTPRPHRIPARTRDQGPRRREETGGRSDEGGLGGGKREGKGGRRDPVHSRCKKEEARGW